MRRLAAPAVCLLLGAAPVAPAAATTGGGLYEPFPGPVSTHHARGFVAHLPGGERIAADLTRDQIAHGVVVANALRVAPSPGPSARAGSGGGWFPLWLLALALLLPVPVLAARFTRR